MNYKIFIVEDDDNIASLLSEYLNKYGFETTICHDFKNVVGEFKDTEPHMVLLDINLPAYDGFYWCGKIREISSCPILFLSSRNADSDQVFAMMNGGDDYVTKPFSYEVLMAKINAQLRRVYGEYSQTDHDTLTCGDCHYSKGKMILSREGNSVTLTKTEAAVIKLLFSNYPQVVTRENLLTEIWDDETFVDENTLNVTISRLRKKLEQIGSILQVKPIRGVGYRIGGTGNECS